MKLGGSERTAARDCTAPLSLSLSPCVSVDVRFHQDLFVTCTVKDGGHILEPAADVQSSTTADNAFLFLAPRRSLTIRKPSPPGTWRAED